MLIEPDFPIPQKSKNHAKFLPIGLLKISSYLRNNSSHIELVRFDGSIESETEPDVIFVTSLFTYWSEYVIEVVQYCKQKFPNSYIIVGGIYASLLPEHCKQYSGCDEVIRGIISEAEDVKPAYDLVDVNYQILHTSRGCIRRCGFCGTYNIEPEYTYKKSIKNEVCKKKLVFYDNNFLANPYVKDILQELIELKHNRIINYCEAQSGFDGRILLQHPEYGSMLREAGFHNIRIAWDGAYDEYDTISKQLDILADAGFERRFIFVFMIYNYELSYSELEKKRVKCAEWGVQVDNCRFRPLNSTFDKFNGHKTSGQSSNEYYIHPNWSDVKIRKFNRNIRRHNISIRHLKTWHSAKLETHKFSVDVCNALLELSYDEVKPILPDAWSPFVTHEVDEIDYYKDFVFDDKCMKKLENTIGKSIKNIKEPID